MSDNKVLLKMLIRLIEQKRQAHADKRRSAELTFEGYQYPIGEKEKEANKALGAFEWFKNGADETGDQLALEVVIEHTRAELLSSLKYELRDMLEA